MYSENTVGMAGIIDTVLTGITSTVNKAREIVGEDPLTTTQVAQRIPVETQRLLEDGKELSSEQVAQIAEVPVTAVPAPTNGTAVVPTDQRSTDWQLRYTPEEYQQMLQAQADQRRKMWTAVGLGAVGVLSIILVAGRMRR